jgi:hypothetical protein
MVFLNHANGLTHIEECGTHAISISISSRARILRSIMHMQHKLHVSKDGRSTSSFSVKGEDPVERAFSACRFCVDRLAYADRERESFFSLRHGMRNRHVDSNSTSNFSSRVEGCRFADTVNGCS